MKRLSGTDALFLSLETPAWHQHVGGLTILEPGPDGLTFSDVLRVIEERIAYAPKFRWKLQGAPLGLDRPVWVDDPDFDVRRHVRRIGVPSPGGAEEVGEVAGTLLSTQLDRRLPLWELWVLEGLAHGRVGVLMKYHHCLLDGVAGASLATALMDLTPDAAGSLVPLPSKEEATAGPADGLALAGNIAQRWLRAPLVYGRYAAGLLGKTATLVDQVRQGVDPRKMLLGPKTSFNAAIGSRRQLAFSAVALEDIRRVKEAHGVKVNDVVVALCASALRSYLLERDELPEQPLTTGVPISTRKEGDTTQDNQISFMFVNMATDVADPVERLRAIAEAGGSAKQMAKALSARQIQSLGEVAAPLILSGAIKAAYRGNLMTRSPLAVNTLVSNVPGPPVPLYLSGARVAGIYPCSVILEGMGLNFTVLSNVDRIDFGLHVDPDLISDPWAIAGHIPAALDELLAASGLDPATPVPDPFEAPADEIDLRTKSRART